MGVILGWNCPSGNFPGGSFPSTAEIHLNGILNGVLV